MTIKYKSIVTVESYLTLDEGELAALAALVGYGDDAFLRVFYEKMGETYLKPHEKSLRSLFAKIRETTGPALAHVRVMRRDLKKAIEDRESAK